ncbi:MAG: hypothetical protein AMXMBFR48_26930 [Ignavibacteriales bacterium]
MKSGVQIIFSFNSFFIVLLVISGVAFAQSSVDSLERYDPFERAESVRRILKKEFSVMGRDYTQALVKLSDEIHRAAEKNYQVQAEANSNIGDIYFRFSDYTKALQYYFQALKLYDTAGDSLSAAFIKLKLGRVHYFADIPEVRDYYSEAGHLLRSAPKGRYQAYYYYIKGVSEKSASQRAEFLKKAIAIQEDVILNSAPNPELYSLLASYYNALGDYPRAIQAAEKADDKWLLVLLLNNQGFGLVLKGNYKEGLKIFERSLILSKEGRFKTLLRNVYENIGRAHRLMGNYTKSVQYMQLTQLVMESLYTEQIYSQISDVRIKYETEHKELENHLLKEEQNRLEEIADAEKALSTLLAALTIIIAAALGVVYVGNRKLKKMNAELDKRNAEIMLKQEELYQLNRVLSESEKNLKDAQATAHLANWEMDFATQTVFFSEQFRVVFRAVSVEPGTRAFEAIINTVCHKADVSRLTKFFDVGENMLTIREMDFRVVREHSMQWIRIKKFIRKNELGVISKLYGTVQDITEQKFEQENKIKIAEQKSYTRELIKYQEEERKKIAGELHDGLGQDLLLIKNRALLAMQNKELDAYSLSQISEISKTASAVLDTLRSISFDLRPVHIERIGLAEVLKSMVERLRQVSQKNIVCDVDDISGLFSVEGEVNLFRIYQEALSNIIKYSEAMDVYVGLHKKEAEVHILVRDNGRGFDYDKTLKTSAGFGLRSIMNRAEFVRGKLKMITSPGSGTVIDISIPLETK